jgi:predicted transcriptional regulator
MENSETQKLEQFKKNTSSENIPSIKTPSEAKALTEKEILDSTKAIDLTQPIEEIDFDDSAAAAFELIKKVSPIFVSKNGHVTGIITEFNILKKMREAALDSLQAKDLISPVASIDFEKNLSDAIDLMASKSTEYLAVSNRDYIFGILTAEKIMDFLEKKGSVDSIKSEGNIENGNLAENRELTKEGMVKTGKATEAGDLIETNVDEFLALLKKGPMTIAEAKDKFGVSEEQIENWISVLENQKIIRLEKHFGKITIKNERKI